LELTAQTLQFDKKTLTVPVGAVVVMKFYNKDAGKDHNFALYTDKTCTTKIFVGWIVVGVDDTSYTFTPPPVPGTYYFRDDRYNNMNGDFIVQ
jgi:hypothetical protein